MTKVEKCKEIGILDDLLENHTEEEINNMSGKRIVSEWLEWEGIINYSRTIFGIVESFYDLKEKKL